MSTAAFDYDALDPGIRDVVRTLRAAGFETTDSGDGVSKGAEWFASGDAVPVPHVFSMTTRERLLVEADRMQALLGVQWRVEASYAPGDASAVLMAWGQPPASDAVDPHADSTGKPSTRADGQPDAQVALPQRAMR